MVAWRAFTPSPDREAEGRKNTLELVDCYFPGLIGIVEFHLLQSFQGIGTEILFIDGTFMADQERFYPCHAILCGGGDKSEAADHGSVHDEIHLPPESSG